MKKIMSFMLSCIIIFTLSVTASAVYSYDEVSSELLETAEFKRIDTDIAEVIDYAFDDGTPSVVLGKDTEGNVSLWMSDDGMSFRKSETDIMAIANEEIKKEVPDFAGTFKYYDVYYWKGDFYILGSAAVIPGSHYIIYPILLQTKDCLSFKSIELPVFNGVFPGYYGRTGADKHVTVDMYGDSLLLAANHGGYTKIRSEEGEYGIENYGVCYYYTSDDSISWESHSSPEKYFVYESNLGYQSWIYEGITTEGIALFRDFYYQPTPSGGNDNGYYYTKDFVAYERLSEEMCSGYNVAGDGNNFNVGRNYEKNGEMAILMQEVVEMNHEMKFETTGFNAFAASSVDGEWINKVHYDGGWDHYQWFISGDSVCIMLEAGDTNHIYKWTGADGEVTKDTTTMVPSLFGAGDFLAHGDKTICCMLYDSTNLLITDDMWETSVKVPLPSSFNNALILHDTLLLIGEDVYACSAKTIAENLDSAGGSYSGPGDVDGNSRLNLADVTLILKHIAKWVVTLDTDAADVTGDGKVTLADVSLILKYIAKWDVVLK